MKITATTHDGFLISATEEEVKSILTSFGMTDPKPVIGLTIPAADFNSKVNYLKNFGDSYDFYRMKEEVARLNKAVESVDEQLTIVKQL